MAYEGMCKIKLYKNKACTDPIESDVDDTFIYNSEPVSNNALKPITFTLYAKNVGTHKAYDVNVRVMQTDYPIVATIDKTTIFPNEIVKVVLSGNFEEGTVGNKSLIVLDYNNV